MAEAAPAKAVISDLGGVLISPLFENFALEEEHTGVSLEAAGAAMSRIHEQDGRHPFFALETGQITEREFFDRLSAEVATDLGREVSLHGLGARLFERTTPNERMLDHMRELKQRGLRMAMLTNNVREWEPLWRRALPIDEIFELVVDSAFVGMRKPDPAIYELTLERLGLPAEVCVFIDDLDVNVEAAAALGMRTVRFTTTEETIARVEAAVAGAAR
jgi:putative hydrolase of the HAD superfamily